MLGAQRLRYRVFVEELGADGPLVDHENRFERDELDPHFDHLILIDPSREEAALDHVVGVYRLLTDERAAAAGRFYSEDEYDLTVLKTSGRRLLELGRSCIDPAYRSGGALALLWQGLAEYVSAYDIEVLFGVASFQGTDIDALAQPLSYLHSRYLAPPDLRVRAVDSAHQRMDLIATEALDRVAAARAIPSLIKSYLKAGGYVGEGAFVDHAFATTDVCLVLDTATMTEANRNRIRGQG